jgi:hypothetical protein
LRVGFADRIGTLDQAIADMVAGFEAPATDPIHSNTKRSTSMATNETERQAPGANGPQQPAPEPEAPKVPAEPAPPAEAASPPAALMPPAAATDPGERLRAEYAEIATLSTQAARLGVTVDAADAMKKGISADALRRTVLDALAARSEAATVIAAAPSPAPAAGDSAIVRRAKERAAATRG